MKSELGDKLRKQMVSALNDFHLIEKNDRIMVAVSGGKDSAVLLKLLLDVQAKGKIPFQVKPVMLDQKQPGFDVQKYRQWVESLGVELVLLEQDTYSIVKEKVEPGKTYCSLCSRLRRGILYNYAYDQGFTKIALGHHRDDLNETLLLNLFYTGKIASMPPSLLSDDGRNVLIRPLVYLAEDEIDAYSKELNVPIMPCNLCGSQENLQRKKIKLLLSELEASIPTIHQSMLRAQSNLRVSQLSDRELWDFQSLSGKREKKSHQMSESSLF